MERRKKLSNTVWKILLILLALAIGLCIAIPTLLTKLFLSFMVLGSFVYMCYLEGEKSNYNH